MILATTRDPFQPYDATAKKPKVPEQFRSDRRDERGQVIDATS